ncbi:hypothetical protein [Streptomyces enissocaesilis]
MATRRMNGNLSAVSALVTVLVLAAAPSALASTEAGPSAASWANDPFDVCSKDCVLGGAWGTVIWGNRTATVQGGVADWTTVGTTVHFEAFAGSTKIDTESRGVVNSSAYGEKPYNFVIGNPDLPGGIDRVRITVCTPSPTNCGQQFNAVRN